MSEKSNIGRLALRVEGDTWNAYWAKPDTMEGALWLGGIRLRLVEDENRKQAFIDLMRAALEDIFSEKFGAIERIESWNTRPAPESERSGSA